MRKYLQGFYLPAMLGASIEYYDIALYGYMAPILVQIFFPYLDKTTGYFLYFLFEFFAAIFQLAGANFFGFIGDKYGRKPAMYSSILGMSCVTFMMCMLPTYNQIGILATILFMLMRGLQSFFLGGEYNGGAIYLMEHEKNNANHTLISGIYCAFTVSGIIFASIIAFICTQIGSEYFRIAYGISFLLGIVTYKMRLSLKETPEYRKHQKPVFDNTTLKKTVIPKIMIASLFFGVLYGLPTRILNALLPIAIGINSNQIVLLNISCLILYMCLLILSGLLSYRHSAATVMKLASITACITSYPLMIMIQSGYWIWIIIAKVIFTILTAVFIGPFHSWAHSLSNINTRYKSISISYAIGKCLSTIFLACSFLIYDHFKNIAALGIILSFIAIITTRIFYETSAKK